MKKYNKMIKIEKICIIPNTWILLYKLDDNKKWKYIDCKNTLDFPYANELNLDINEFQNVKKYDTKLSWCSDQIDICIDFLKENGEYLIEK